MGIHLHKKLGWGLTGLEYDQQTGRLTDPRVNADALAMPPDGVGPEYLQYVTALRDAEPENSDEWFDLSMTCAMVEAAQERSGHLPWPVSRETESGRKDLLLIQPIGFGQWSRYADPIDQAEENALYPDEYCRVVEMPYGIYPFEGVYMDSRDGRRVDATAKRMIDRLLASRDDNQMKNVTRLKAANHLAATLGFENAEDAQRYIAPLVPSDIRHVISWMNLLKGPDVWLQLRPMLYVYWS
jgi:hypothetical protein